MVTMNEHDVQWGVLRSDRVVEILASERLARIEAAREGGQVVHRTTAGLGAPWRRAVLDLPTGAAA